MEHQDDSDREVVSLMKYHNDIRFPAVHALRQYWEELRGPRQVPSRAEVDPRAIEETLEYAFILERIAPGVGRFRLAGMHLNDLMGMEVRGMPCTSMFMPEHRATLSRALEDVFAGPSTALLTLAGERGVGRPPMDAQMLLLPLASDFGDVTRALGCLCTIGPIGRSPRRFIVKDDVVRPIRTGVKHELTDPPQTRDDRLTARRTRQQLNETPGFSEPAASYTPPQPRTPPSRPEPGEKPRLRLVRSDGETVETES
ncbi:PAS domain-containing protein [Oceanicola sp. 502str15]|uniref:PAS domain-containing protein n=1 Tax=Oceanicola sp. 502str15 TaxID=2696061 RepID=UPI0020941624|nr:PAS domain-containing protein [Oceanicola sp. 502str15]MCO6382066.1 PAS domain-containing protein [Oceanicola sp. 502str15]